MVLLKVWKAGTNTLAISIPKNYKEVENIEEGDYLDITIQKHIKKEHTQSKTDWKQKRGKKKENEKRRL